MLSIRSIRRDDLESLLELTSLAPAGLTTLMLDEPEHRQRIEASIAGTAPLLVMVDSDDRRVIGTAGLFTRVGDTQRAEPFYAYRIERSVHRSASLGVHLEVDALHLVKMFNGPTELGTLFLHPEYRGGGNGRLLSLSRFLFMLRNPAHYDRQLIAELRGLVDDDGQSVFWDALGRHFFRVEFSVADSRSARDKQFIAELMPTHPIYVPLLPPDAQAVIGQVHNDTRPARALLESEGFYFSNMVDIFEAGPCVRCDTAAVRTIRQSRVGRVAGLNVNGDGPPEFLVSNVDGDFRLVGCPAERHANEVHLPAAAADRLQLRIGDPVRLAPMRGFMAEFGGDNPIATEQIV